MNSVICCYNYKGCLVLISTTLPLSTMAMAIELITAESLFASSNCVFAVLEIPKNQWQPFQTMRLVHLLIHQVASWQAFSVGALVMAIFGYCPPESWHPIFPYLCIASFGHIAYNFVHVFIGWHLYHFSFRCLLIPEQLKRSCSSCTNPICPQFSQIVFSNVIPLIRISPLAS